MLRFLYGKSPATSAALLVALLTIPLLRATGQSAGLSGSVKNKATSAPIDSAIVTITNIDDPLDRYTVVTDAYGLWSFTVGVEEGPALPEGFRVNQNYPNPFNPSTRIVLETDHAGEIELSVYNVLGQVLDRKTFPVMAGVHTVEWMSKGAAGVLFYEVEFGGRKITRKMVQLDGHGRGGLGDISTSALSIPASAPRAGAATYSVVASKLIYMPDSAVVAGGGVVDFALETVHSRSFVFDLHNDVMEKVVLGYQLGPRHTINQSDLPRFHDGGMDAQMFALWTDWTDSVRHPYYSYTLEMADSFQSQIRQNPGQLAQATSYDDLLRISGAGMLAGVLGVEGGHAIENSLDKLRALYALGARYMTITWNNTTPWAVAAADAKSATLGLSAFGMQVIRTMDSLGMIIDVSHTGIMTIRDILATTRNPIIASHSGARALNNHYRNLTDAQIDSIAHRGGVIGVVFYPPFLSSSGRATIDTVIRHIDYIKNRVGVDHVAIGSDYDGIGTVPSGLEDVSKLPNLTAALLRRGYSVTDVQKILGGNYLRVFKQVCK